MLSIRSCDSCGSCNKLSPCSKCKGVYFCCKDHQISGWKNHRSHCVKTIASKFRNVPDVIENSEVYIKRMKRLSTDCDSKYCIDNQFEDESRKIDDNLSVKIYSSCKNEQNDKCSEVTYKNVPNKTLTNEVVINSIVKENIFGDISSLQPLHKDLASEKADKGFNDQSYDFLTDICYEILNKNNKNNEDYVLEELCKNVVKDMDKYGVYVVDNFLGREKGNEVLKEVRQLHSKGVFQDGQLLNYKNDRDSKTIRSDRIAWIDGKRTDCLNIDSLIKRVDTIVMKSNRMLNNGEMGNFKIDGRTKAMVACYPSGGSHYVKHVDNPNQDGRRITVIYYLNKDWDSNKDGGLLRIFPAERKECVADIEPIFDRLLFFWSDRRNPHEVQPAFRTRYAITLWYFDAEERKQATLRNKSFAPTAKRLNTRTYTPQNLFF